MRIGCHPSACYQGLRPRHDRVDGRHAVACHRREAHHALVLKRRAVTLGRARAPRRADHAALCLLRFGDAVALEPIDPADAVRAFAVLEPGFDLLADDIAAAVAALAQRGVWSLTLSRWPDEAIALLADNFPLLREGH